MASMSSMLICEANLRAAAGGFIGAKSGTIGATTAESPLYGLRVAPFVAENGLSYNRPIAISQIRVRWVGTAAMTATNLALELHKTTCAGNHDTGGHAIAAYRKKVSGYTAIPSSEIDAYIADTGAISGGSHSLQGSETEPFLFGVGAGTQPVIDMSWTAEDGIPLVLEQNEGLLVHNASAIDGSGAGLLFVGIDFFRF